VILRARKPTCEAYDGDRRGLNHGKVDSETGALPGPDAMVGRFHAKHVRVSTAAEPHATVITADATSVRFIPHRGASVGFTPDATT